MIDNDLFSLTGRLESFLRDAIREASDRVLEKRKETNEKTWRRATEGDASDFRDRVQSAIDSLEELYEEIKTWPEMRQAFEYTYDIIIDSLSWCLE
jgi:hypothetical protein